jgi:hypothetical protein
MLIVKEKTALRRRMVRGKTVTIMTTVRHETVAGRFLTWQEEWLSDELVIDMLVAMHFGGVKVIA